MKIIVEFESLEEFLAFRGQPPEKERRTLLRHMDGLDGRTLNVLLDNGLQFVEDVLPLTESALLKMPNLGRRSLDQWRAARMAWELERRDGGVVANG